MHMNKDFQSKSLAYRNIVDNPNIIFLHKLNLELILILLELNFEVIWMLHV
ncbi:hypothetical protein AA0120_g12192 [Alternaria tenuissima]|nr:hypothetical protein AA0120_g12192 [Alternaria tenuissima]